MKKKLAGVALAAGLVLGFALPASATNLVVNAYTGGQRTTDVHVGWKLIQNQRNYLLANNMAFATSAGCQGCRTTAIAVAIVLDTGADIHLIKANDTAHTFNVACLYCDTTALAFQFIVAPGQPETFTTAANDAIEAIMDQVQAAALSGENGDQLTAQVTGLMGDITAVLTNPASYTTPTSPPVRVVHENLRDVGYTQNLQVGV